MTSELVEEETFRICVKRILKDQELVPKETFIKPYSIRGGPQEGLQPNFKRDIRSPTDFTRTSCSTRSRGKQDFSACIRFIILILFICNFLFEWKKAKLNALVYHKLPSSTLVKHGVNRENALVVTQQRLCY